MASLVLKLLALVINSMLLLVLLLSLSVPFRDVRGRDPLLMEIPIPHSSASQDPAPSPRRPDASVPCYSPEAQIECTKLLWIKTALDVTAGHYILRMNCTKTPLFSMCRSLEDQINEA